MKINSISVAITFRPKRWRLSHPFFKPEKGEFNSWHEWLLFCLETLPFDVGPFRFRMTFSTGAVWTLRIGRDRALHLARSMRKAQKAASKIAPKQGRSIRWMNEALEAFYAGKPYGSLLYGVPKERQHKR